MRRNVNTKNDIVTVASRFISPMGLQSVPHNHCNGFNHIQQQQQHGVGKSDVYEQQLNSQYQQKRSVRDKEGLAESGLWL